MGRGVSHWWWPPTNPGQAPANLLPSERNHQNSIAFSNTVPTLSPNVPRQSPANTSQVTVCNPSSVPGVG